MRMITVITAIALFFCPYFARADTPQTQTSVEISSAPNIKGWNIINTSRIELIISDQAVVYLGLEVEYSNPGDPDEHVKVISRHIPLAIARHTKTDSRLLREAAVDLYLQKEENDRLTEISTNTDPILFAKWRTTKNPLTGRQNKLDGDVNIWFLPANGKWIFSKNQAIDKEFMTENINSDKPKKRPYNVFSGMKYQVGDTYHILRVDRNILKILTSKEKQS